MSLSSESIQKKEFHIVFKGYKPEEVDKFLDMLSMEFDGMQKKIKELEEKVDSLKYEGDNDSESSKMKKVIQEALVSAHRMAEEIKQKAKIEAEEMVSRRKMEEEQEVRKLQNEKTKLESDISVLRNEYTGFKDQISRFADDFKLKMTSIGDGNLMDAFKNAGLDKKEENNDYIEPAAETEPLKSDKDTEDIARNDEEIIYKHARKDKEENIGENDLKDLAALTDEMLEKLNKNENKTSFLEEGNKPQPEKNTDIEEEKRNRKKIDIANPDIINDFFKTDED